MNYRPDIDGLRALAVLAVLFYHLHFSGFTGGYVGVDVFFVLSGYLITGTIRDAVEKKTFSYGSFYARRVRRLLPAASATLLCTAVVAVVALHREHIANTGGALLHATASLSNIYFWMKSGYFDADAELNPLLHTWSLGVEEQFYLFWPVLVVAAARRSRAVLTITVLAIAVLSFAATEIVMREDPQAAFFLTPLRAWEFCLGGLCVGVTTRKLPTAARELLNVAGLSMIVYPAFSYTHDTLFPGRSALLPCVGTVFVLLAADAPISGLLLRNKVATFLGQISYSLYLVHWPIIVFFKHRMLRLPTTNEQLVLAGVSLGLAVLLWRFVEQRYRVSSATEKSGVWSGSAFGLSSALVCLGIAVIAGNMWACEPGPATSKDKGSVAALLEYLDEQGQLRDRITLFGACYLGSKWTFDAERCLTPDKDKRNILVVGDSYAASAYAGLARHLGKTARISLAAVGSCRPIMEPTTRREACRERNKLVFEGNLDLSVYEAIVLVGAFNAHDQIDKLPAAIAALRARGARQVLVLGSPHSYSFSARDIIAAAQDGALDEAFEQLATLVEPIFFEMDRYLKQTTLENAAYVSALDVLCPGGLPDACVHRLPHQSVPLIADKGHLTVDGAMWLSEQLAQSHDAWKQLVGQASKAQTAKAP